MPELPEVESIRLGLVRKILTHKILSAKVLKPKLIAGNGTRRVASSTKTKKFITEITGRKILEIRRLAKNLIFILDNQSVLVIHLKMTGQLVFVDKQNHRTIGGHPIESSFTEALPNKHTGIIFTLDNGTLYYNDVRMFGYILYYKDLAAARSKGHFQKLGLEPFAKEFTLDHFLRELKKYKKSIKGVLLDQSVVTGCGNIYSDEACFAARVRPMRPAQSLTKSEVTKLYKAIPKILKKSIEHGGTSISDYLNAEGKKGNFMRFLKVYGREGQKCLDCGINLKKTIVAGRTTIYCPKCQK